MEIGKSERERHAPDDQTFWEDLVVKLLHSTQLLVIEAIWWIEEPLSATLFQEKVGEVPVRGATEKLFDLAGRAGMKHA